MSLVATGTVINVNDDERGLYVVSKMLRLHGYQVLEAKSGAQALEMADLDPDVMVLDIRLPDINGYEVCRRLKAQDATAHIKVLHTSATYVTPEKKVRGFQSGADGYLTQPFEIEELVATVAALCRLKAAEKELRARAERLAEADRRKDEFLAMLAHELRNPLAAVSASLPLLQRHAPRDELEGRARDVIGRQTRHLGRLVDDLLDVARVTRGQITLHREPVEMAQLLNRVVANAEPVISSRAQRVEVAFPEERLTVSGDATRLEQVFTNLLDNASKYTDPGGTLALRLTHEIDSRGAWVSVRVRDSGIGISREALPEIFSLFSQSGVSIARSRGGLGIGLTLVRTLVELHSGTVIARSEGLGQGSEFEVRLPALTAWSVRGAEVGAGAGAAVVTEQVATAQRVLIIEDNSDARQALQDLCTLWGHDVVVASDGLSGVQAALSQDFDVALVDIGLPGIDGYEVARRLRVHPRMKKTLLVALTGYGSHEQRQEALGAGFHLHLVKPVDSDALERLLAAPSHALG